MRLSRSTLSTESELSDAVPIRRSALRNSLTWRRVARIVDPFKASLSDMSADNTPEPWLDEALISAVGQLRKAKSVEFWPGHTEEAELKNAIATNDRRAVLFDSDPVEDPIQHWAPVENSIFPKRLEPAPFKVIPSQFIAHAKRRAPRDPLPTASGFSAWLYSLYSSARGDDEDRERGKTVEKMVLDRRRAVALSNGSDYLREAMPDWKLSYSGLGEIDDRATPFLEIKDLRVRGSPLRVSPDLLYYNARASKVAIVEIKHTRMLIPTNLWPNIWGQLWCYAQLGMVRDATSVSVIGEVWGDRWTPRYRSMSEGRQGGEHLIVLRASVRRDPRERAFDTFFRALFEIYAGT